MSMDFSRVGIRIRMVSVTAAFFLFSLLLVLVMLSADTARAALPASAPAGVPADAPSVEGNVPSCDLGWGVVSSPNVGTSGNALYAVAAIAPDDVWAVGYYADGAYQTLTEHWDGSQWNVISSPILGTDGSALIGVAAISTNDVWAAGFYYNSSNLAFQTLIEHWDGSQWNIVDSPNVGTSDSYLQGIAAISAGDVWAVGYYHDAVGFRNQTLTEHWDGSTWSVVSSPNVGTFDNFLYGVAAISANDVWAVGSSGSGGASTLTEHWDGSQWNVVSSPNPGTNGNYLHGVTAIASDDVWAVGYYILGPEDYRTLTEHWDGSTWSVIDSPNPDVYDIRLEGVTATASDDVWAVGHYYNSVDNEYPTLTEHWDGSQWNVVFSPSVGTDFNLLFGVAAIAADDVWTAGYYLSADTNQTLTEHYSSLCLTSTPTPTYTLTPTPTATITLAPSSTPTDTPTDAPTPDCELRWRRVGSENPGTNSNYLFGVAGITASDAWSVGTYYIDQESSCSLVEHWNGSTWSTVASANSGVNNELKSVSAVSSNDVWAVGYYASSNSIRTLIEHWDGTAWGVVASPNPGPGYNYLWGVNAISASDVWAVGSSCYFNCQPSNDVRNLVVHWDGSGWEEVTVPDVPSRSNVLFAVSAAGSNDIWAAGETSACSGCVTQTLSMHWDGNDWTIVPSPNSGNSSNTLRALAVLSGTDAWAAGYYYTGSTWQTLIEHWDGSTWSVASSPNPGADNYLQSISAASPNDIWAVGYSDQSSLTMHWDGLSWGVVASPVTTGTTSLAGVAAQATDYVWAVGTNTTDIQYTYAQLYNQPCPTSSPTVTSTGTSTPSAPTNTPTAPGSTPSSTNTPSSTTSSTPAGTPTGTPTNMPIETDTPASSPTDTDTSTPVLTTPTSCAISFEDVPVGSTFYPYIQCMACRGIINGYPCGGAGEPCNGNNDPYFRPGNNVTRGQFAKITSNAAGFNETPGAQQYEDVLPGSTFYDFIWRLSDRGLVNGYPCGGVGEPCGPSSLPYFRPAANATRGQASKIVSNTFFPNCQVLSKP